MKKVCFFSSDARPLYKKDVFRAMSYPKDFVIHFRYQPIHVNEDVAKLVNKSGMILFTIGNNLSIDEDKRVIRHVSIRDVTIQSIEIAEDTGLIHFYLKLGEFKNIEVLSNPEPILPPHKLVTELEISEGKIVKWYEIIDLIKSSFPNQLFYKFKISRGGRDLLPQFNTAEKQSYYKLSDEGSYSIEMAFYDTESSASNNYHSLKISAKNENLVKVVAPATIDLEARRDNRKYSITTQTVSSLEAFTYLNFETVLKSSGSAAIADDNSTVDTTLKIEIAKSSRRTLAFSFYTVLAAVAVGYAKLLSDKIDINGSFSSSLTFQFIFPVALGLISAYKLYQIFDKK